MEFSGPGFTVHGWWIGVVVGMVVLVLATGNWRLWWRVPVMPPLRELDPPYLAGGQAAIGASFLVCSALEMFSPGTEWRTIVAVVGGACFVGGLVIWGYGGYYSVGPPEDRAR